MVDPGRINELKTFGNAENLSLIVGNYEQFGIGEDGSIKDSYLKTGKNTDAHTLEKDLMDIFGIDRSGDYNTAQQDLTKKMYKQIVAPIIDCLIVNI